MTSATRGDDTATFRALLDAEWEYVLEQSPTWASTLGDRRWNDRWSDVSPAVLERRAEHNRELLGKLKLIDRAKLPPPEQLNYDLFTYETNLAVEEYAQRL